ncbi:MAG: type II toxin-antitoxin system RelE/ParE family toxin [Bacteroidales bacterium]|nr:type II toxin-antitoxin system RelE/ParE family toxin [Bacteroidales bacterium]
MNIIWHKRADAALHDVEDYVLCNFGEKVRQEFMDDVDSSVLALARMPEMGPIDPLFEHRKQTYRSIIVRRLNKVVYYIKGENIHIVAFWDVRREPKNQARRVKDDE